MAGITVPVAFFDCRDFCEIQVALDRVNIDVIAPKETPCTNTRHTRVQHNGSPIHRIWPIVKFRKSEELWKAALATPRAWRNVSVLRLSLGWKPEEPSLS
ncbi:hypothetical protein KC19_1G113200 [Ceratodon purpureus]|uniref:Uncharacterized protein n=1 Tax=Ceratodon purpureus TaxID=3225 RepID=A0A8T0J6J3_CERPU|nr:hypothetical protein KC19_1G113200 [Ceratodon purpureus]